MVVEIEEGIETVDRVSEIESFLKEFRDESGRLKYRERIRVMILENRNDVEVDFGDIISFSPSLADFIINNPDKAFEMFSEAIKRVVELEYPEYLERYSTYVVRFRDVPHLVKIRDIRSTHIGKLISIEGIVVRSTPPKQRMVKAVFLHEPCGNEITVAVNSDVVEKPTLCPFCGKSTGFRLLEDRSEFEDFQRLVIQERPEEVPPGQLPRSIEADVRGSLVDTCRPGDRVNVVGVLRLRGQKSSRKAKTIYDVYIDVNNIIVSQRVLEEIEITKEDEERILELARDPMIRRKIISSIAPGIYGMWDIKEAIALLLFGGVPKVLPDGTRIRGDIHVLIIGDPGTAKSQLLQYVTRIAPRAIYTTGRGSTAAGLTAAVVRDKQTGEYYLEAGALVLADGGIACIDEIDKMREEDRVAIHEAMEQQTVSIAKAGIVARLNARTAILAAGNPKYGRYLPNRSISENVNLPPTILSRFDLIFVIRDTPSMERDRNLARHITLVHGAPEGVKPPIEPELLRKYIAYARKYVRPVLTEEARRLIEEFFVEMRKRSLEVPDAPIAITARQLEALIRLAEAHARMALRDKVTAEDAAEAIRLMKSMLESVGIDVESGEIDVDVIMTGKPKSQREKMLILEEIIRELAKEEGCAKVRAIVSRGKQRGLDERFIEEMLTKMKREGLIFEAKEGCYAFVL
ncbi:MAG TPA: minichromosome maintenance protein MCM [Ignisphaera aggregans]|uniref:DNA helicase n=1 Tax=Ignisphaera aggregans TaxID=334771 RepID=A0A832YYQ6_9CREN|nr:minichromosome maintenance protein MCM [Ignisphaera aggregans]